MSRKLLFSVTAADCKWDYFRGSGAGGQNRNKRDTAVRCTHPPSGAVGTAQDERYQRQNKKLAFKRMAQSKEFQRWLKIKTGQVVQVEAEVEKATERAMRAENLKIEVKKGGKWVRDEESAEKANILSETY